MPKRDYDEFYHGTQSTLPRKTPPHLAYPRICLAYGELGLPFYAGKLGRLAYFLETSLAHLNKPRSAFVSF